MRLLRVGGGNASLGTSSYRSAATMTRIQPKVEFCRTMDMPTAEVQAAVQQLVMEHGGYSPLELLLATNRLGYEDYRAWREGDPASLDAALAGDPDDVREWLEAAQSWAGALGLDPEPVVHHGWEEAAGTVLVASADRSLNTLLSTWFRRIREHDQLDLFIDGAQTAAVNALIDALAARDAGKAGRALGRLVGIERDHGQRFHAAALIAALEAPVPQRPDQGLERLHRMEREWLPAATALLGVRRRDFLAPLWRDLGRALDPMRFDPRHPERHASRAYREGLDWERLRRSVLAVPGYGKEPVLLTRLAEAEWRLRNRAGAVESWFALCRFAPEEFERLVEASDFPDWALRTAWRLALDQDLEPEMTPAWFPAWMLLEEPGLAGVLEPCRGDDDPSRAFDTVIALLARPDPDEQGIELRRVLQAIHPGLLARYLAKRSSAPSTSTAQRLRGGGIEAPPVAVVRRRHT